MEVEEVYILLGIVFFLVAWFLNLEFTMYLSLGLSFIGQTKRLATLYRLKYSTNIAFFENAV